MKLSKRQLRNTIRKVLRESSDLDDYEKLVSSRRSQKSAPSLSQEAIGATAIEWMLNAQDEPIQNMINWICQRHAITEMELFEWMEGWMNS